MEERFVKINKLITEAKNILIVAHCQPDDDAVGSALALKMALKERGVEATTFIDSYSAREFASFPEYKSIKSQLDSDNFDLVLALDYGNWRRLSITKMIEGKKPMIITFDHHLGAGNSHIGEIKVLSQVSSTCELLFDFFQASHWTINKKIAACLLAGIVGDSGGLIHASLSAHSFAVMAELLSYGLKINKTIREYRDKHRIEEKDFSVLSRAIGRIKEEPSLGLIYLVVDHDDLKTWHKFDFDLFNSILISIKDCRWTILLVEYEKGKTKVSLRSRKDNNVDVSKIAEFFGGGGHKVASAFHMNKKPKKVLKKVIRKSQKVLAN